MCITVQLVRVCIWVFIQFIMKERTHTHRQLTSASVFVVLLFQTAGRVCHETLSFFSFCKKKSGGLCVLRRSSVGCCTLGGGLFDGDQDADRQTHGHLSNRRKHTNSSVFTRWFVAGVAGGRFLSALAGFIRFPYVPTCKEEALMTVNRLFVRAAVCLKSCSFKWAGLSHHIILYFEEY